MKNIILAITVLFSFTLHAQTFKLNSNYDEALNLFKTNNHDRAFETITNELKITLDQWLALYVYGVKNNWNDIVDIIITEVAKDELGRALIFRGGIPTTESVGGPYTLTQYALDETVYVGLVEATKACVEFGLNVNHRNSWGNVAIIHASEWNPMHDRPEMFEVLVRAGANINSTGGTGIPEIGIAGNQTPLSYTAIFNRPLSAKKLMELGANLNFQDINGMAAIHYATIYTNLDILKDLINHKADVNIKNIYEKTPLALATSDEAKEMIIKAGGHY